MEDASNDVTFFSAFMQDQADGMVKMRPCSPTTAMVAPGRPGGPGALPEAVYAVWAYTIGTATFADPCAIQYVRSAIIGNRFDSNPRYVRVREALSGSDASRVVTMFSAFMQDIPDGVVKLISCSQFKQMAAGGLAGNIGNNGSGNTGNGQELAAMMTGTFDTSAFGVLQMSPGGGNYSVSNGSMAVSGFKGMTVEGTWRQSASGGQCTDGSHRGRFRITFAGNGFEGLWSYCDNEPNYGWSGTRRTQ